MQEENQPYFQQGQYSQQQQYPQQYPQQQQYQDYNQTQQQFDATSYGYAAGFAGYGYGGYGDAYYNMYDPVLQKDNIPHKQDTSMHVNCIVGSVIFWAGVIVSGVGANNFL